MAFPLPGKIPIPSDEEKNQLLEYGFKFLDFDSNAKYVTAFLPEGWAWTDCTYQNYRPSWKAGPTKHLVNYVHVDGVWEGSTGDNYLDLKIHMDRNVNVGVALFNCRVAIMALAETLQIPKPTPIVHRIGDVCNNIQIGHNIDMYALIKSTMYDPYTGTQVPPAAAGGVYSGGSKELTDAQTHSGGSRELTDAQTHSGGRVFESNPAQVAVKPEGDDMSKCK